MNKSPNVKSAYRGGSDQSNAIGTILNAAERVFARYGYEGTAMRMIAEASGISQALIHYHFKTKEKLYDAVFSRRASNVNPYRLKLLEAALQRSGTVSLDDILDAFFTPAAAAIGDAADSDTVFSQIVSSIVLSGDERSIDLMTRHYDPLALAFIAAFRQALPSLSREDAVWAYLFAHGARMQAYAENGRAARLSGRSGSDHSRADALAALKRYTAAGIRGLADGGCRRHPG